VEPLVWRPATSTPPGGSGHFADNSAELRAQAAQLQQQFEHQVREAHAAGMREGEAAGRARAAAEVQPVIERLARSMDDLAGMRARLRAEAEADLVQLPWPSRDASCAGRSPSIRRRFTAWYWARSRSWRARRSHECACIPRTPSR
jgi:hypothetical protein